MLHRFVPVQQGCCGSREATKPVHGSSCNTARCACKPVSKLLKQPCCLSGASLPRWPTIAPIIAIEKRSAFRCMGASMPPPYSRTNKATRARCMHAALRSAETMMQRKPQMC
eukprot:1159029-Pelagomonas_calceolata.AAC.5